jgi:hypothetical protein
MAGRPVRRAAPVARLGRLSGVDVDHVRQLRARAAVRAYLAACRDRRRDRGGARDPAARSAAALARRIRLHRLRADGRAARTRPLYARRGAGVWRRSLRVPRLALPALAIRPAVHAAQLRDRATRRRRLAVGVQSDRGAQQPRRDRADRARGRPARALATLGERVRRAQPAAARARGRRRAQRHADHADARARARADRRREPALPRRRSGTRGRRRREGDGRSDAAIPRARAAPHG